MNRNVAALVSAIEFSKQTGRAAVILPGSGQGLTQTPAECLFFLVTVSANGASTGGDASWGVSLGYRAAF